MRRVSLIVGLIFFSLCLSRQVWAFTVAPAIIEVSGSRGEILNSTFTLVNTTESDETYYFETLKFQAKDESGSPLFIPYSKDHSELPDWLSFTNKTVIIPKNSFAEIPFSITIPSDIHSGSYYAAITVSDNQASSNPSVSTIQTKTAILIFLNVKGENKELAALLDFVPSSKLTSSTTDTLTYRIQNQGNVYLQPQGTITLKNAFGRIIATEDANLKGNKIMTGSTRKIETIIDTGWTIGPITAELKLNYGENQQTLNSSTTFWIFPLKTLGALLAGLILLILSWKIIKKTKKA